MSKRKFSEIPDSEIEEIIRSLPEPLINYWIENRAKPFETLKVYAQGFHDGVKYILKQWQSSLNEMRETLHK